MKFFNIDVNKLRIIGENILVKLVKVHEERVGKIIIPKYGKEKIFRGVVLKCGQGKKEGSRIIPLDIEEGDVVVFKWTAIVDKFVDTEEEEELAIIKGSQVMAVLGNIKDEVNKDETKD